MKKQTSIIILLAAIFLVPLINSFFSPTDFALQFINTFFMIGLFYLACGAFLFVVEKGFFNGIIYSMKRLRRSTMKGKLLSQFDDIDKTDEIYIEYEKNRRTSLTKPFLYIGILSVMTSFIISYLFYT